MKSFVLIAAIGGFLAVLLGAFGAHALQSHVEPRMLHVWQTAVQYQMFHSIALLVLAVSTPFVAPAWKVKTCWCFIVGMAVFSGSLYLLVLTDMKLLGMLTPLGGVSFLLGWGFLIIGCVKGTSLTSDKV